MKQFSKDLGNVCLAPKGKWSREQEYERLALVYNVYNNLSYIAKINVPSGVDIENREYWQPMNATGYADNNFINLTTENENGTITAYESLEEAVATILPINRRVGATLSFYNLNSDRLDRQAEFELWQFNSTDLANWENKDYWNNIYYNWNVFVGWYIGADALNNHVKIPNVGQYAYVGTNLNDALLYQCRTNGTWTNTGIKVRNYISVVVSGNITIGENGNWFSGGKDTGIPATPAVDEQLDDIIIQLQQHTTEISNLKKSDANLQDRITSNDNEISNLKKSYANLQDRITSNDNDITSLTAKHKSLSKTVQGITATGGASTATNVTYNNASGLNAENVQDAIDELSNSKTFLNDLGNSLLFKNKIYNINLGESTNVGHYNIIDFVLYKGVNYKFINKTITPIAIKTLDNLNNDLDIIVPTNIGLNDSKTYTINNNSSKLAIYSNSRINIDIIVLTENLAEEIHTINEHLASIEGIDFKYNGESNSIRQYFNLVLYPGIRYNIINNNDYAIDLITYFNDDKLEEIIPTNVGLSANSNKYFEVTKQCNKISIYTNNNNNNIEIKSVETTNDRVEFLETKIPTIDLLEKYTYGKKYQDTFEFSNIEKIINTNISLEKDDYIAITVNLSELVNVIGIFGNDGTKNVLLGQSRIQSNTININVKLTNSYDYLVIYIQRKSHVNTINGDYVFTKYLKKESNDNETFVNVCDFGSDNTGIVDSINAINNAISYAIVNHKNVYFPYGKYMISAPISIQTNEPLTIYGFAEEMSGVSYGVVIFASKPMNNMINIIIKSTSTKIFLKHMMLNGNNLVNDNIIYTKIGYVELERIFAINSLGNGINFTSSYYAKCKDIIVSNCKKNGILIYNAGNLINIVNSQITNNAHYDGYNNIKITSDGNVLQKNCNIKIESTDLSSTKGKNTTSVFAENTLAILIMSCYFETSEEQQNNENYNHIRLENTVDSATIISNFIGMANVYIDSKHCAIIGNDFCNNDIYNKPIVKTYKLSMNNNAELLGNNFSNNYNKEVISTMLN